MFSAASTLPAPKPYGTASRHSIQYSRLTEKPNSANIVIAVLMAHGKDDIADGYMAALGAGIGCETELGAGGRSNNSIAVDVSARRIN